MTMWINLTFGMVVATMWKSLVLCARETIACWKQRLVGYSGRSLGDKNSERYAASKDLAHDFRGEKEFYQGLG